MTSGTERTRAFVMLLVAWLALSAALVAGLSTEPAGAFAVVACGLVAAGTLRFTAAVGVAIAIVAALVFAVVQVVGPVPPWAFGADEAARLGDALHHLQVVGADLAAAVALLGTAATAELASAGLEWEDVMRETRRQRARRAELGSMAESVVLTGIARPDADTGRGTGTPAVEPPAEESAEEEPADQVGPGEAERPSDAGHGFGDGPDGAEPAGPQAPERPAAAPGESAPPDAVRGQEMGEPAPRANARLEEGAAQRPFVARPASDQTRAVAGGGGVRRRGRR